jgi:hypothetical protein
MGESRGLWKQVRAVRSADRAVSRRNRASVSEDRSFVGVLDPWPFPAQSELLPSSTGQPNELSAAWAYRLLALLGLFPGALAACEGSSPGAASGSPRADNNDGSASATTNSNDGGVCNDGAACPSAMATSTSEYPSPLLPAGDGGDAAVASVETISSRCAGSTPRPQTAGSYTEPNTGLTVHWPDGWALDTGGGNATFATVSAPITWVPTGSTTALAGQAQISISAGFYGNASQASQVIQGQLSAISGNGGIASALTLAGQPAVAWWDLSMVPEPACPAGCGGGVPASPELMNVDALIQFTMIDAGGGFGVEVDVDGVARADAQPEQVFCDMEAMIRGVTLGK